MRHAISGKIERAAVVVRCGQSVVVRDAAGIAKLVQAAEGVTASRLAELAELSGSMPGLVLTAQRGVALGTADRRPSVLMLPSVNGIDVAALHSLVEPTAEPSYQLDHLMRLEPVDAASCEGAAVRLATIAGLLPAALVAAVPMEVKDLNSWTNEHHVPLIEVEEVAGYQDLVSVRLRQVVEARIPLSKAHDARVVVFRSGAGGVEHFAIIVGRPRTDQAVLTRVHSECFTGDVLGSLRCDCGDQLHRAIEIMATAKDGGVLLYLPQEGRGIGLVNKLRAYVLQDRGFDTVEANEQLGFRPDERSYLPAAAMLHELGITKVRLMTNNPEKVAALIRYGIHVVQRVPLSLPLNTWNATYLRTKKVRSGHLIDIPGAVETGVARAHQPGASECRAMLRQSEI